MDDFEIWKTLATIGVTLASVVWSIYAFYRNKQDKEETEKRRIFINTIFEKEDRQSRDIKEIKESVNGMRDEFVQMKIKFAEDRSKKDEMIRALRDYIRKMDATIAKQQQTLENLGRVILKDK